VVEPSTLAAVMWKTASVTPCFYSIFMVVFNMLWEKM
jgi:hypothetical protein